jgi:CRP/FNR family cyclic AMP-dependent transcriptional regulator
MKAGAKEHGQDALRDARRDARRLREYAAFEKVSDNELERLVLAAHHISTSVPLPLIHEQTPPDACYILLSGEVGVYVGQDRIAVLGPGEVIGESVLRRGQLRSATVTTIGRAEVLRIERDDLATLVEGIPALRDIMDATVAKHVPAARPPKQKPQRSKVNASVSTDLVERFEQAADNAGVGVGAALEAALTQWIERNGAG